MDSFLSEQIGQRASNTNRLKDLISSNKNRFESEWKNVANEKFQTGLSEYTAKLQNSVANDIANQAEITGVLSNVPTFYSLGQGTYKNILSKGGKEIFDKQAKRYIDNNKSLIDEYNVFEKKVGDVASKVTDKINNIKSVINKKAEQVLGNVDEVRGNVTDTLDDLMLGGEQNEIMESGQRLYSTGVQEVSRPTSSLELGDLTNTARPQVNEPEPMELSEPIETGDVSNLLSTDEQSALENVNIPIDESVPDPLTTPSTEPVAVEPTVESAAAGGEETAAAGAIGEEAGAIGATGVSGSEAATVAAAASLGPGAALLGAGFAAAAIGYSIYDLFTHHSHKPKKVFRDPTTILPAIQSSYNISKTILPSSVQTLASGGTMSF